ITPYCYCFSFHEPATTEIYTLSLHDALPIYAKVVENLIAARSRNKRSGLADLTSREEQLLAAVAEGKNNAAIASALHLTEGAVRSEEHTSELQSRSDLVCRLLLEKKKRTLQQ